MEASRLPVNLCGVRLRNPLVLASGILGTSAALLERIARAGAGAVTTKSCSLLPRAGHPNPTVLDWGGGLINAVGLSNPGVEAEIPIILEARERLWPLGVPVIASIFAETVEQFGEVARRISEAAPDLIEVNISCPNVEAEFGRPFAADCVEAAAVTRAVKAATKTPVLVKISPNVTDVGEVARAVEDAGADGIVAVNTLGPGMLIDVDARRPVLANRVGGVSGEAIRPIALRCVYDICKTVKIPVVGLGGVSRWEHTLQMVMAGATAVGIGSAVYQGGPDIFGRIAADLEREMATRGIGSLDEVRGAAIER